MRTHPHVEANVGIQNAVGGQVMPEHSHILLLAHSDRDVAPLLVEVVHRQRGDQCKFLLRVFRLLLRTSSAVSICALVLLQQETRAFAH